MDISEMITGVLVFVVLAILVIDTVAGWRPGASERRLVRAAAAAPARHSLDPSIGCDIVWC